MVSKGALSGGRAAREDLDNKWLIRCMMPPNNPALAEMLIVPTREKLFIAGLDAAEK